MFLGFAISSICCLFRSLQEGYAPAMLAQYYRTHIQIVKPARDSGGGGKDAFFSGASGGKQSGTNRMLSWWCARLVHLC